MHDFETELLSSLCHLTYGKEGKSTVFLVIALSCSLLQSEIKCDVGNV